MKVHDDVWLGTVMGHPCFRLETPTPENVRRHAAEQVAAFYFAKVATADVETVRALNAAGFFVADVNVTFERDVRPVDEPTSVVVREHDSVDTDAVLRIAESCFRYSRFHLDPLVSRETANKIKREWIANYASKKRGDRLFVATLDGVPAGFLAALVTADQSAVIDLVGVSNEFQRRRVGEALCARFINHYVGQKRLVVGTQVANVPSCRLYEKLGFAFSKSQYVMHLHVRDGRAV